jgi:hypothetical protein
VTTGSVALRVMIGSPGGVSFSLLGGLSESIMRVVLVGDSVNVWHDTSAVYDVDPAVWCSPDHVGIAQIVVYYLTSLGL